MLHEIKEKLEQDLIMWHLSTERVDKSYDIKIMINDGISIYKSYFIDDFEVDSCIATIEFSDGGVMLFLCLDEDSENELYVSISKNYVSEILNREWGLYSFKFTFNNIEECYDFLTRNFWSHDFGYCY